MPLHDAQPMALDVPADMKGELVCLAVPLAREGVTQVGFDDAEAHELRRWKADSEELRDHTNAADEPEAVQTGALDLRLVRAKEAGEGYALLGVARVIERRSDNQVLLDPLYIAPQTRIDATPAAVGARDAAARPASTSARARSRRAWASSATASRRWPTSSCCRRSTAPSRCFASMRWRRTRTRRSSTSPACSSPATCRPSPATRAFRASTRRIATTTCTRTFVPVIADLRRMLSTVLERNAVQIELVDRSHGVRTAVFPDAELARTASFVLAVNAQMPAEQLRSRFPAQSKLGPVRQAARPRQPAAARRRPALAADGAAPAAVPRGLPLLRARPRRRAVEAAREERQPRAARRRRLSRARARAVGDPPMTGPGRLPWIPRPSMIRSPIATIRPAPSSSPIRAAAAPRRAPRRDERHRRRCRRSRIPDRRAESARRAGQPALLLVPQLRATRQVADPAALAHLARPGHPRFRRARAPRKASRPNA